MLVHRVSVFWLVASSSPVKLLTLPCTTPSLSRTCRVLCSSYEINEISYEVSISIQRHPLAQKLSSLLTLAVSMFRI